MKYLPIVFTVLVGALTFNPILAGITLISALVAYVYAPTLIIGIFMSLVAFFVYILSENGLIALALAVLSYALLIYIEIYRRKINSIEKLENFDWRIKLFGVTPMFAVFVIVLMVYPAAMIVSNVSKDVLQSAGQKTTNPIDDAWEPKSQKALNDALARNGAQFDNILSKKSLQLCYDVKSSGGDYRNPYNQAKYYNDEECRLGVYWSIWKLGGLTSE